MSYGKLFLVAWLAGSGDRVIKMPGTVRFDNKALRLRANKEDIPARLSKKVRNKRKGTNVSTSQDVPRHTRIWRTAFLESAVLSTLGTLTPAPSRLSLAFASYSSGHDHIVYQSDIVRTL